MIGQNPAIDVPPMPSPQASEATIINSLYQIAYALFPNQTQQATNWVYQQAINYGIGQAQLSYYQFTNSPWFPLLIIGGLFLILRRR